jgi:hypothetical protein
MLISFSFLAAFGQPFFDDLAGKPRDSPVVLTGGSFQLDPLVIFQPEMQVCVLGHAAGCSD